jgi:hypothetical protein
LTLFNADRAPRRHCFGVSERGRHNRLEHAPATWIVVANDRRARVLEAVGAQAPLVEADVFESVEPGVSGLPSSVRVSAPADEFSTHRGFIQTVSAHLEGARDCGLLGHLILIAPARTLRLFRETLSPDVRAIVSLEMEDDLVDADPISIRPRLPVAV